MKHVVVDAARDGARVDRVVVDATGLAMAVVRRLCADGRVRSDRGARLAAGDRVATNDVVVIAADDWLVPVDAPLTVLWHDDDVLIVDKPAGLPCHPMDPGEADSVVHRLVGRHPGIAMASTTPREGGLIHRLDTGTSGCLAVARHRDAWLTLRHGIDDARKTYLAVVVGDAAALDGTVITDGIAHDHSDRRRMTVDPAGQPCRTDVAVLGVGQGQDGVVSLVQLGLQGGRRHQLRLHLASRQHPLVGDDLYGGPGGPWALLHAWQLTLPGRPTVTAPLPAAFVAGLNAAAIVPPG
jgi:23S rRNA pseudouridine1911/1915/1917 synthase